MTPNQIVVRNLVGVVTTIAATTGIALWLGAPSRHAYARSAPPASAVDADSRSPLEIGAWAYEAKGCIACHTIDGSPRIGPSFKGSWGTDIELADGVTLRFDADYVRSSLEHPQAQARAGYPPAMPTYGTQLSKREIEGLIVFIESLR
jgi:cytochrome c oxidase subunit II